VKYSVKCILRKIFVDQTPDNKEHTSNGHTKGGMGFDASGGFWLVHSVPRFPVATGGGATYNYPEKEKEYGQSFICMSYGTSFPLFF
jgi:deoxyribonuclease-2